MYQSSALRSTLNKTDFFGAGFHNFDNPYTLLWPNGDFSFIIPRHRVCRFDNLSTILCLACGRFDDPSKGAESAACRQQQQQQQQQPDCVHPPKKKHHRHKAPGRWHQGPRFGSTVQPVEVSLWNVWACLIWESKVTSFWGAGLILILGSRYILGCKR